MPSRPRPTWQDDCHGRVDAGATRAWDHHWQGHLEGQCAVRRVCNSCLTIPQPRYVVLGTGASLKTQNDILAAADNSVKSSTRKGLKPTSSKPSLVDVSQQSHEERRLYISIYKAKVGLNFLSLAHSMSDFSRVIGSFCHNIQCPPSNHAKSELCSIESRVLRFQRSCSK